MDHRIYIFITSICTVKLSKTDEMESVKLIIYFMSNMNV